MFSKTSSPNSEQIVRKNILILLLLTTVIAVVLSSLMTLHAFPLTRQTLFGATSYFLGNVLGRISSLIGIPFLFLYFARNNVGRALGWFIWFALVVIYFLSVQIELL